MTAIGDRTHKARKAHTCDLCATAITKGTTYRRWGWADDGSVVTVRAHLSCLTVLHNVVDCDEWSEPPVREHLADEAMQRKATNPDVNELPVEPLYLGVIAPEDADESRAVWAALKVDLDDDDHGLEDGSTCPGCLKGTLDVSAGPNCSCHLSPPCTPCVEQGLVCDGCGWRLGDELEGVPHAQR